MGITKRRRTAPGEESPRRPRLEGGAHAGDGHRGLLVALVAATALLLGTAALSGCDTATSAPKTAPAPATPATSAAAAPAMKPAETEPGASDVKAATPIPSGGESYPS